MDDRYAEGQRASRISLALNGGLALIKLVAGFAGNSYALIADAVESLGDIFSSLIVWGGLAIAAKPADRNHPYGHGKAEPLAALLVAAMLILAGVGIAFQAVREIQSPGDAPAPFTLIVLLGVIVVKETMYRYECGVARRTGSTAVHVDAWHHRSDALTSAAAAVGIAIALVGGEGYEAADDWAALVACAVIVFNGARFGWVAGRELMDTTPDTTLPDAIQTTAVTVDGARFVEKVLIRKMGPRIYVDLHLEVDPELSVRRAHRIAHDVKDRIMAQLPQVADVLVHVEPHEEE